MLLGLLIMNEGKDWIYLFQKLYLCYNYNGKFNCYIKNYINVEKIVWCMNIKKVLKK